MSLLSPANLWFLAITLPIVVLYFLKLRRTPVAVGSTLLWQQALEDLRVNSPFQRIRNSLLLWLQLLVLVLLVLALTRLFVAGRPLAASRVVVLLDTSASMGAREPDGRTRFAQAVDEVRKVLGAMREGDKAQLMTFERRAHVVVPFTDDRRRLRRALESLQPRDTGTDPAEALTLATAIARQYQEQGEGTVALVVVSDGAFGDVDKVDTTGVQVRFVPVGAVRENVGLVALSARPRANDRTRYDLACRLQNAGSLPRLVHVEFWHEGVLIDTKRVTLAPDAAASLLVRDDRLGPGIVRAQIVEADALLADNTAWLVLPPTQKHRVLLVSTGHFFLEALLEGDPDVELRRAAPGDAAGLLASPTSPFDLVIYDGVAPEHLAEGAFVFLHAVPPLSGFSLGAEIARPLALPPPEAHPLLTYVNVQRLAIKAAPVLTLPAYAEVIVEGIGRGGATDGKRTPLIAVAQRDNRRLLIVGFDTYETNWWRETSWPMFWANTLGWMHHGVIARARYASRTSEPLAVPQPEGAREATLYRPDGSKAATTMPGGDHRFHFGAPGSAGMYDVRFSGSQRQAQRLAINFLDVDETRIAPKPVLALSTDAVTGDRTALEQHTDLWRLLALIALGVLLVEWFVYHRRPFGIS